MSSFICKLLMFILDHYLMQDCTQFPTLETLETRGCVSSGGGLYLCECVFLAGGCYSLM